MHAPSPQYVQIEPVGQCNLRCQMCPIPFREDGPPHGPPAFMDFAVFTRLIDQFANLRDLHLQGLGEPMMHPRFPDLVRLARRLGMTGLFVQHLCHDFAESSLPAKYRPMRDFVQTQTLLDEDVAVIEQHFGAARQAAQEAGIELRLPRARPRPHDPSKKGCDRCSWPFTGAYVSYQGLAMPCCMIATPDR